MIANILFTSIIAVVMSGCGDSSTKEPAQQQKPSKEDTAKVGCSSKTTSGVIDIDIGWGRCPPRPCDRDYPTTQPTPYPQPRPDYPPRNPWPSNDGGWGGSRSEVQVCTCMRPPYNHEYANYCEVRRAGIPNPSTGEVCWPNMNR